MAITSVKHYLLCMLISTAFLVNYYLQYSNGENNLKPQAGDYLYPGWKKDKSNYKNYT